MLLHIGKRDTGPYLDTIYLSLFFLMGRIFTLFHRVVNVPAAMESFEILK